MGKAWDSFTVAPPARSGYVAHNDSTMLADGRGLTISASARNREAFVDFLTPIFVECLRVLKPGGYALVWALPRTSHWTATALEDAGFEIRDVVVHLQSQGFPKGKGCLKPAAEHWVLCRRPGPRVLPLNIDECRVGTGSTEVVRQGPSAGLGYMGTESGPATTGAPAGRWPANVTLEHSPGCVCRGTKRVRADVGGSRGKGKLFDGLRAQPEKTHLGYAGPDGTEEAEDWACHPECAVRLLDEQAGERNSGGPQSGKRYAGQPGGWAGGPRTVSGYTDSGNASRFFYVSKADRADRGGGNDHPCTKSTALMQWLVRLVSRPGETVLDPFMGSGSTGVSCLRVERRFVGVERDPHYFEIARRRLADVDGPLFASPAGEAAP